MPDATLTDQAFSEIFDQYREPLHRYVIGMVRDASETDDVVQETFLKAYRKLSSLREQDKLSSWLYRIATNVSYERFRQSSRRPRTESFEQASSDSGEPMLNVLVEDTPRLDSLLEQREMSDCVQEYIEELSDDYRAVILLHDLEGLTNPEIAEMLGCSLATAKIRLHRARQRLKTALDQACEFSRDDRGVFVCERKPASEGNDPT